ncbi:MAG: ArsR/SmtB family transcription factor [Actinomycetota bacterium]
MHADIEGFTMPPHEAVERAAASLRLLADPTRMKVLWALAQGESSVSCLAELAGANPPTVSQHLAKLRLSGLVTARREGTFIYYSVADAHVARMLRDAVDHAGHGDLAVAAAVAALTIPRSSRRRPLDRKQRSNKKRMSNRHVTA